MGLDCTHDAFTGSNRRFDNLRRAVAEAGGGYWPEEDGGPWRFDDVVVPTDHHGAVWLFLGASDTPGVTSFAPAEAVQVAAFLEWVAPRLPTAAPYWGAYPRTPADVALQFAKGCRLAARNRARLRFR